MSLQLTVTIPASGSLILFGAVRLTGSLSQHDAVIHYGSLSHAVSVNASDSLSPCGAVRAIDLISVPAGDDPLPDLLHLMAVTPVATVDPAQDGVSFVVSDLFFGHASLFVPVCRWCVWLRPLPDRGA